MEPNPGPIDGGGTLADAHAWSFESVEERLKSGKNGLSDSEALDRRAAAGPNELEEKKRVSPLTIFVSQFQNPLSLILILAGILSFFSGKLVETMAIFFIVILNAALGFVQEYRAEQSMELLRKMASPVCRVRRNGEVVEMDAALLVPGDRVLLETGDIVPADMRLALVSRLAIDESMLTGESLPSEKMVEALAEETPVADRENMAYMGTIVTAGSGEGIVTAIGMRSEFGRIAHQLQAEADSLTPLQIQFERLARDIGIAAIGLIALVVVIGMTTSHGDWAELLLFALVLATATIPSALPLIVTLALSRGAKRLSDKNMLIRKLPAAESLGSTTVICTDKTGTLTMNRMHVEKFWQPGLPSPREKSENNPPAGLFADIAYYCRDSKIEAEKEALTIGDPLEIALVRFAHAFVQKGAWSVVGENPFDGIRKRSSVIVEHAVTRERCVFVKGAPDLLFERCTKAAFVDRESEWGEAEQKSAQMANMAMASHALRVIGFAFKRLESNERENDVDDLESGLVFCGLAGLWDPPREGVREAIMRCERSGIQVVMVTGDQKSTAIAMGQRIGLWKDTDVALSGSDLDRLDDAGLKRMLPRLRIVARALPDHKVRIVQAFQKNGEMVAVTGDGVNDAPALKAANVGIAMGLSGTAVTKDVSDAILVDDHFSTIVNAIEEGRAIYDKIIKSARYLLSCNSGEIFTVLLAVALALPIPLLALQVLFINLVTDTLPAMGLGSEPPEKNTMDRPPRKPSRPPLGSESFFQIVFFGFVMAVTTLVAYEFYLASDPAKATTIAFTLLVIMQILAVVSSRSFVFSLEVLDLRSNPTLAKGIALALVLQLLAIYWPPLQAILGTVALSVTDWSMIVSLGILGLLVIETGKGLFHFFRSKQQHAEKNTAA